MLLIEVATEATDAALIAISVEAVAVEMRPLAVAADVSAETDEAAPEIVAVGIITEGGTVEEIDGTEVGTEVAEEDFITVPADPEVELVIEGEIDPEVRLAALETGEEVGTVTELIVPEVEAVPDVEEETTFPVALVNDVPAALVNDSLVMVGALRMLLNILMRAPA